MLQRPPRKSIKRIVVINMTLTENKLDDMVHILLSQLKANGIELDSDMSCDLNDVLSTFLEDKCGVDVAGGRFNEDDSSETFATVSFLVVAGTIHQYARVINKNYTEADIVHGLTAGTLVTTAGYKNASSATIGTASGEVVAELLSQDVCCHYSKFR
jgi:hypothetical protein